MGEGSLGGQLCNYKSGNWSRAHTQAKKMLHQEKKDLRGTNTRGKKKVSFGNAKLTAWERTEENTFRGWHHSQTGRPSITPAQRGLRGAGSRDVKVIYRRRKEGILPPTKPGVGEKLVSANFRSGPKEWSTGEGPRQKSGGNIREKSGRKGKDASKVFTDQRKRKGSQKASRKSGTGNSEPRKKERRLY